MITELTSEDRGDTIEVLAESFHDYPVFTYVLQESGDRYEAHLRLLIGFFVDARLMRGWPVLGVRSGSELTAAMLVSDPVFVPRPTALDPVHQKLKSEVGGAALERLDEFESALDAFEPDLTTYFVGMIGVRPAYQGRGYGRVLMDRIAEMSRSRPESAGVTLTTETTMNVPFYQHLGYRVLGKAEVGELTTWLLMLDT